MFVEYPKKQTVIKKVCWFGCYDSEYSRNQILLEGLRINGIEIVECNIKTIGLKRYVDLISKLRSLNNDYDVLYCAFPAWFTVPIAWLFQKRLLVVDAFYPSYDSFVNDRKRVSRWSLNGWLFWVLDILTARLPDAIVVDTNQHLKYWQEISPKQNITVIPVGAATTIYRPLHVEGKPEDEVMATFFGSFIPLQGVDKLALVAKQLHGDKQVRFRFIGPEKMLQYLREEGLNKLETVELLSWQLQDELNQQINDSDIILGIFGDTAKADRVIPNKVFQGLAAGKLVITKDTPAIRELFSDGDLCLVSNRPSEIVTAIKKFVVDASRREDLAMAGHRKFLDIATPKMLGKKLIEAFEQVAR